MANILPNLRGGSSSQLLYGATHTITCLSGVEIFNAGTEQRWCAGPPLHSFTLNMPTLDETDRGLWKAFFESVLGRLQKNLQLTVNGTTYDNLALVSDLFNTLTQRPILYDIANITLKQILNYPYSVPTVGGTYPVIVGTGSVSYPYATTREYYTSVQENPFSGHFAYPWYGASLTGFPSGPLNRVKVSYPVLVDADVVTLSTYFLGKQGKVGSFTFHDPILNVTLSNMRFDQDSLVYRFSDFGISSTEVTLRQFNA